MKFFLPGQNINPKIIATLEEVEKTFLGINLGSKFTGVALGRASQETFEDFLKVNSDSENAFADENDNTRKQNNAKRKEKKLAK